MVGTAVAGRFNGVVVALGLSEIRDAGARDGAVVDEFVPTTSEKTRSCSGLAAPDRMSILLLTRRIIFCTLSGTGVADAGVVMVTVFINGVSEALLTVVGFGVEAEVEVTFN